MLYKAPLESTSKWDRLRDEIKFWLDLIDLTLSSDKLTLVTERIYKKPTGKHHSVIYLFHLIRNMEQSVSMIVRFRTIFHWEIKNSQRGILTAQVKIKSSPISPVSSSSKSAQERLRGLWLSRREPDLGLLEVIDFWLMVKLFCQPYWTLLEPSRSLLIAIRRNTNRLLALFARICAR